MTTFKDKSVLVLGGVGFVGSHLCDELIKTNLKKLIIFDNLSASTKDNIEHLLKDKRVEFRLCDVRNYAFVDMYVSQSDFVFHLSACNVGNSILNPEYDLETNALGTLNVLQAVKKYGKKMFYASSGSIINPTTPYAISKWCGENYCKFFAREYATNVTIMRYYHVFGPRQSISAKCGVVNIFLSKVLQGLPPVIWGAGDQIKCFTYVKDSVKATMMLAEKEPKCGWVGEVYDVATNNRISINELAEMIIDRYAEDKSLEPVHIDPKIGENLALHPDTSKIKALGWKPEFTFEEGLEECRVWVEEQLNKK